MRGRGCPRGGPAGTIGCMEALANDVAWTTAPPAAARRFRTLSCVLFFALAVGAAAIMAAVAVAIQPYFAPLLLFPILVGAALGAALLGGMRLANAAHRSSALAVTALAVLVMFSAQHYFSYRVAQRNAVLEADRRETLGEAFPELAQKLATTGPPRSFGEFLQASAAQGLTLFGQQVSGAGIWVLWTVDLLLSLAATIALVVLALRRPFCDVCGSWYRGTRRGPLDHPSAHALACALSGSQISAPQTKAPAARYRLLACRGGCGATGCQLSWNHAHAATVTQWLNGAGRDRVTSILDSANRGAA